MDIRQSLIDYVISGAGQKGDCAAAEEAAAATTIFNDVNSIPVNVETTIVSYTVPADQTFSTEGGSASGRVDATFRFYVDDDLKEVLENAWTDRNVRFSVVGMVSSGKIIKITVEHRSHYGYLAGTPHDFAASIFGSLY